MGIQITIFGNKQFEMSYEDEEIRSLIDRYIQNLLHKEIYYFTYYTLCKSILTTANKENRLVGMDPKTYYESPDLAQKEYTRVSRLLWERIREGKLFVDFSDNKYIAHYDNDTILGIITD